jgi:hypothetical protein
VARSCILGHFNSKLPVARLPTELLTRIFSFCLPIPKIDILLRWNIGDPDPGRNAFSPVCRSWRMIALNAPELWTAPPLQWPKHARETIHRANDVPLNFIYDDFISSKGHGAVKQIAKRPARMVALSGSVRLLSDFTSDDGISLDPAGGVSPRVQ